jgi:hypothetical protein
MSGGYARNIEDSVEIHFNTAKIAVETLHATSLRFPHYPLQPLITTNA